jgi:hypothetical protein
MLRRRIPGGSMLCRWGKKGEPTWSSDRRKMEWKIVEGATENFDLELQWRRRLRAPASKFGSLAAHNNRDFWGQKQRRIWGIYRGISWRRRHEIETESAKKSGHLRSLLRTSSGDELWLEVVDDSWVPAVSTKEKKEPEKEAKQRRSCCQADAGLHARVRGSNSAGPAGRSFSFILF